MKSRVKKTLSGLLAVELISSLFISLIGAAPARAESTSDPVRATVTGAAYGSVTGSVYDSAFTSFVTVQGDKLMEGPDEFRFASINYPGAIRDSAFSQEDALRTIAAMGGRVTRTYVPPVKRYDNANASYALVLGPDAGGAMQFNEEGFRNLDRFLALANQYGVRVIIPFVDQWQWEGGIESYVNFRYPGTISNDAANDEDAWKFYTDPQVIADFKQVIHYMMNRVNTVTGVKYKEDRSILAWETGNELGGYNQDKFPQSWTTEIARYIQEVEQPSQLLLDGRFAVHAESLGDPNIDVVGNHFYTGNFIDKINGDQAMASGKKPYILGEFGLYTSAGPVDALYDAALKNGTDGIMIWSLRPHKQDGGFFWHDENPGNWASYHWPGFSSGDYYGEKDIIRTVYKYAHYMNTGDVAKSTPVPEIPAPANAPLLLGIDSVAAIRWQGSVGASGYEIQRSMDGVKWTTVEAGFSDGGRAGTPAFHDRTAITGQTYMYRVRGVNESGASDWSNTVSTTAVHRITDEMSLLYKDNEKRRVYAYDHSSNVQTSSPTGSELGIGYKAFVSTAAPGYLTYASPVPLSRVRITAVGSGVIRWYASPDNTAFQEVQPVHADGVFTLDSLPAGTRYIKFSIPGNNAVQIDQVQLEYEYSGAGYQEIPALQHNGFIVDDRFTDLPAGLSNLTAAPGHVGTEGHPGLVRAGEGPAELLYTAHGDLNSYRFTAYSNGGEELSFQTSIDGETYTPVNPSVQKSAAAEGWSKLVYSDFALPAAARYIKVVYPAGGEAESPVIIRVEVGYGGNMIPLTPQPPANVFEDAEYSYGLDANLKSQYTRHAQGDDISIGLDTANKNHGSYGAAVSYAFSSQWYAGLTKQLQHVDLSTFDALHGWVKPDGSENSLSFQFKTGDSRVWEAKTALAGTAGRTFELPYSAFVQPQWNKDAFGEASIKLDDVVEFSIYVSSADGSTANSGLIHLDDLKMANASKLDSFEGYGGYNALIQKAFSRNAGGGSFDVSLDAAHKSEGSYGLKVDYNFAGPGYAGGSFNPDFLNLNGYDGFTFWLQPDGSNNELAIQFTDASGKYWETKCIIRGTDPRLMMVPFDAFRLPGWYSSDTTARPDPALNITAVSFYIGGSADSLSSSGTLYLDDINGARFLNDLQAAEVTLEPVATAITALPHVIRGTAKNARYVSIQAGSQRFHAPVQPDGSWSYPTSKLANGSRQITASIEMYDGTAVKSASQTLEVDVPGNPYQDGTGGPVLTNYLLNPGFDEAVDAGVWPILPAHWVSRDASGVEVTSGIVKLEASEVRSGTYRLVQWNDTPFEVTTSQEVNNLPDGMYELRAWTKSKGGQLAAEMIAEVDGQAPIKKNLPPGTGAWTYIKISGLEVRDGTVRIGFHSKDLGGNWIAVDDVELVKTGDVADTGKPVITLKGSAEVKVAFGAAYQDAGATAADEQDGDLTSGIVVTGTVDTMVPGVYTLRYNVKDAAGNAADEVIRTVTVKPSAGKAFVIEPAGALDRTGGLSASVRVSRAAGTEAPAGDEVVYFQLMKGNTPVSYVALTRDLVDAEQLTAHFDVSQPADSSYHIHVFVLDSLTKDPDTLPGSLSHKIVIQ